MDFDDSAADFAPARPVARPRVSQQRYLMRRLGALAVLAALVLGVLKLADALFGADGDTSAAVDTSLPGDSPATAPTDSGAAGVTVAPDAGLTATTAPAEVATPPSAADPAKMLILGDSDAGAFGPYLESLMAETGIVSSQLDYKVSSGLARPDFFDWPAHLATLVPGASPDIVVVGLGGNDAQALTDVSGSVIVGVPTGETGGDVEWRAEYGRRVGDVMDYLVAEGRIVVWVGIPNAADPDFTSRLRALDEVVRAEAAERPGVRFVDTWQRFSGIEGGYAEYRVDPRDGVGKDVRADDGFHLNTNGAEILALDIAETVRAVLREQGAAL